MNALADRAGVTDKTLRSLERGERWPLEVNRAKIEKELGWERGDLARLRDGHEPRLRPQEQELHRVTEETHLSQASDMALLAEIARRLDRARAAGAHNGNGVVPLVKPGTVRPVPPAPTIGAAADEQDRAAMSGTSIRDYLDALSEELGEEPQYGEHGEEPQSGEHGGEPEE
nr:hypothetical protein [Devriesea agamarum]